MSKIVKIGDDLEIELSEFQRIVDAIFDPGVGLSCCVVPDLLKKAALRDDFNFTGANATYLRDNHGLLRDDNSMTNEVAAITLMAFGFEKPEDVTEEMLRDVCLAPRKENLAGLEV